MWYKFSIVFVMFVVVEKFISKKIANDNEQNVVQIDRFVQPQKPCLLDLLLTGRDALAKVNVKEVRKHAMDCPK
jgi:hypothetical protein